MFCRFHILNFYLAKATSCHKAVVWPLTSDLKKNIQDEQDMRVTAEEARASSLPTFFFGLLNMDAPVLSNQQELTAILSRHGMTIRGPAGSNG